MNRLFQCLLALVLAAIAGFGSLGCGKDQGQPNPDLVVPDIPEAGSKTGKKSPDKAIGK